MKGISGKFPHSFLTGGNLVTAKLIPVRADCRNSFMASINPAWVLVKPEGNCIIDNFCSAVEYGKNLKFTLAEVAKVTAAYFASSFDCYCIFTHHHILDCCLSSFKFAGTNWPGTIHDDHVINYKGTRLPLDAFIRRVYKQKVSQKFICSDFDGGNFLKLCKRKTRLKIKRTKKQFG